MLIRLTIYPAPAKAQVYVEDGAGEGIRSFYRQNPLKLNSVTALLQTTCADIYRRPASYFMTQLV